MTSNRDISFLQIQREVNSLVLGKLQRYNGVVIIKLIFFLIFEVFLDYFRFFRLRFGFEESFSEMKEYEVWS